MVYQCRYCEEEFSSLGKFEQHCYSDNQADHRRVLLQSIEDEAKQGTAKVNAELQKDIDNAIKAKANKDYKTYIQKQRAEDAKAKNSLPFVPK